MAWYYNVKAAQQVKQQAAQTQIPPQNTVSGTGSINQPLGADPATPANVVKQVPASGSTPAKVYVRSDYQVASKTITTSESGEQKTTITLEPKIKADAGSQGLSNDLFSGNRQTLGFSSDGKPVQPIIRTNEQREIALEVLTAVAAPVLGPELLVTKGVGSTALAVSTAAGRAAAKSIVIGEVVGAGLSVAPQLYNAAMGQEVTLSQYAKAGLEGAAVGGAFSVVGGKAVQLAGKAIGGVTGSVVSQGALKVQQASISQELAGIGVRTGVNMGLGAGFGAGAEFVETGQVTPKGVVVGAAFGAAFSAGGELAGLGAPVIRSKMVSSIPGQRVQARLNEYYVYGSDRNFHLGLGDKVLAKATGLRPQKPAPEPFVFKDVVTARESEYVTVRPAESKFVDSSVVISRDPVGGESFVDVISEKSFGKVRDVAVKGGKVGSVKSEVVDVIGFKEEVPVGEFKVEKADLINMNPDKTRVVREAELWDPTQVAYGRSVSRESVALEAELARARGDLVGGSDLGGYGLTSEELMGLRSEVALSGASKGQLSFNKKYEPVTGDLLKPSDLASPNLRRNLDFVGKVGGAIEGESTVLGFKELQGKIRAGEYKGVLNPANENKALDQALSEAYKNIEVNKQYGVRKVNPYAREVAVSALEKSGVIAGGKGDVALISRRTAKSGGEIVSKQHLDNLVAERAVTLGRASTQSANPFVAYAGPSYYRRVSREDEDSIVYSYPKSGLAIPESPTKTRRLTEYNRVGYGLGGVSGVYGLSSVAQENRLGYSFAPMIGGKVSGLVTPKVSGFSSQEKAERIGYVSLADSGLDLAVSQGPVSVVDSRLNDIIAPIEGAQSIPKTSAYTRTANFNFGFTKTSGSFYMPDFKLSAGGFGDSFGRKRGVGTRRRRYPILSAKEFLKL
jgi:hypothetical protein